MFKGVFMDIDGTMLDSNAAHAKGWSAALRENGFQIPYWDVLPLIGMDGGKLLSDLTGINPESEQGKVISKRSDEVFEKQYLADLHPFPRVRELLVEWKRRGIRLAVTTSAGKKDTQGLLAQTGVSDLFEFYTTSDDVDAGKPDPDVVRVALERCALPADQVVLVGDTPYDVAAARKSAIAAIGVRCGGWTDDGLRGAIAVFDGPADILECLDREPLSSWFPREPGRPR
jgi:HAD superfamily hydrolase (TIGR01549 family)